MYYRVAIQRQGNQLDRPPSWQWQSTVLSSLQTLLQFLRLYSALPQDHLRVFSSPSRESLREQLMQENQGPGSHSVTAAQFMHDRLISSSEEVWRTATCGNEPMVPIAALTEPSSGESSWESNILDGKGMSHLEKRWEELERGSGGDHDRTYRFTLPASKLQVLAWMTLLARVQRGELHP